MLYPAQLLVQNFGPVNEIIKCEELKPFFVETVKFMLVVKDGSFCKSVNQIHRCHHSLKGSCNDHNFPVSFAKWFGSLHLIIKSINYNENLS